MHPGRQLRKGQDNAGKLYFSRFAQDSVLFHSNISTASILMPHWNFPFCNLWVHVGYVSSLLFNFMAKTSKPTFFSSCTLLLTTNRKNICILLENKAGNKHCSEKVGVGLSRCRSLGTHSRYTAHKGLLS